MITNLAKLCQVKDCGAGTVAGEWAAAMRYFSGGTNVKYYFYGDNVVSVANKYQKTSRVVGTFLK